ncbi:MAG: hypothetical protein HQK89_17345 [Nitrospirae bacterium]|nr:hypothetical protein [Nitrospirota bacterium]
MAEYDNDKDRKTHVGIMALTYEISYKTLFIPNILAASFSPYFFPGYSSCQHGCVASLDEDYSPPYERCEENSAVREWVHDNLAIGDLISEPLVELVGYFR